MSEKEKQFDRHGTEIKPGHILEKDPCDPKDPWRYFVCYDDGREWGPQIRDLNANNVGMCDTGPNGNVKVLGHIIEVYNKMEPDEFGHGWWGKDDWEYYFSVPAPPNDFDSYFLREMTPEMLRETWDRNNFPKDWTPEQIK